MSRLSLLALSGDDLPAFSALVQDAALRTEDMAHEPRRRRLVLLMNRYRWEAPNSPSRVRTAIRIEGVLRLQHQNWPAPGSTLALLSLEWSDPWLTLRFSGGPMLRAECEALDLLLEDLTDPGPAANTPSHKE